MPLRIPDIVRQRSYRERQFIGIPGVPEQVDDKVARAHVVRQVGEQLVAEGIVADVLDDAAGVGIRPGMLEFWRRQ